MYLLHKQGYLLSRQLSVQLCYVCFLLFYGTLPFFTMNQY